HMEGVRLTRWLLSPIPTFKLWRRMKLWELRSYEQVIKLEQDRLIYQARLQARFGRAWRRKAPVEALMPLRLAKYGVPLAETAPAGLAAAGVDPVLLPPAPVAQSAAQPELPRATALPRQREEDVTAAGPGPQQPRTQGPSEGPSGPAEDAFEGPGAHESPWFAAPQVPQEAYESAYNPTYVEGFEPHPVPVPAGPGRTRPLGSGPGSPAVPQPQFYEPEPGASYDDSYEEESADAYRSGPQPDARSQQGAGPDAVAEDTAADAEFAEAAYPAFLEYVNEYQDYPSAERLDILLADRHGVRHPRSTALLKRLLPGFQKRLQAELEEEHIA
ncbi:DUF2637 domain-containing protein, partial [Streptomyces sp. NPDC006283]|uniref:DUF2637 domain-containing protein n=1 Tax=Streptomyces sp. NPDC006283 TaxID=3156741 RepID=UPI0033A3D7C2